MLHLPNMNSNDDRTNSRLLAGFRFAIPQGVSVGELIIVIAIVGLITFLAIPHLSFDSESEREARDRRNAQSIVTVYQSGFAAGVSWNGTTRNAKIDAVIAGQSPAEGAFSGKSFKAPAAVEKDRAGAFKYIGIDSNGDLYYDKSGVQPSK